MVEKVNGLPRPELILKRRASRKPSPRHQWAVGDEQVGIQWCQGATVGVRSACAVSVYGESCEGDLWPISETAYFGHVAGEVCHQLCTSHVGTTDQHATGARTNTTLHSEPRRNPFLLQCPLLLRRSMCSLEKKCLQAHCIGRVLSELGAERQ